MKSRKLVAAPRQLTLDLDPVVLRGLTCAERNAVVTLLASLLLEAGGLVEREEDDESV